MTDLPDPKPLPSNLSYSQVSSFSGCGERYRLEKIFRIPRAPGWALVGGKALHRGTELLDLKMAGHRVSQVPLVLGHTSSEITNERGDFLVNSPEVIAAVVAITGLGVSTEVEVEGAFAGQAPLVPEEFKVLADVLLDEAISLELQSVTQAFVDPKDWRASGRVSKAYPEKENQGWWREYLPVFLCRWWNWRLKSGYTVAMIDDRIPAVEMDVSGFLGADTTFEVRSFLDRVMLDPAGNPVIVDVKTSSREPASGEQMGLYGVLLEQAGFPKPMLGYYWLAREGDIGKPYNLENYTRDYFDWKYEAIREQRNAGKFFANPDSPFCGSCEVRDYCWAKGGEKANEIPRPWVHVPTVRETNV